MSAAAALSAALQIETFKPQSQKPELLGSFILFTIGASFLEFSWNDLVEVNLGTDIMLYISLLPSGANLTNFTSLYFNG